MTPDSRLLLAGASLAAGLFLTASACTSFLGLEPDVDARIEVDPTIVRTVWYRDGRPADTTLAERDDIACLGADPWSCRVDESIAATIHNDGRETIFRHYDCLGRLRRVVLDMVEPPQALPCLGVQVPPAPIEPGDSLVELVDVRDAEPGTYRVGFTLTYEAGEPPEGMTLSEPFELR